MDYYIDSKLRYDQYKDKTLLILGGGPSTAEVNWKNVKVDYKWSCTNFFMNQNITEEKLDLVSLGNLQDLNDPRLLNYLDSNTECKVLFENNYLYSNTLKDNIKFIEKYKSRIYYGECDKSFTGIVGPPARLIILASNLGFKNIYFLGIDGFDSDMKNTHSFTNEPGLREGATHNTYEKYYNDHTKFAENIHKSFGDRINFYNLGEAAKSHNIMSAVSRTLFPLKKETYEIIR